MSNSYFKFKQFTVHQEKCAMKVCTDSCVFGAFAANDIHQSNKKNILDIGSGTGLLSLMIAQQNASARIHAVELDEDAFKQTQENFSISPWKDQLDVFHTNILEYKTEMMYDYIVSNPPFYENSLQSSKTKNNAAKHDTTLTLQQLLESVKKLLSTEGKFAILLPFHRLNECVELASKLNFHVEQQLLLKQTPSHNYFRAIIAFTTTEKKKATEVELTIKNEHNNYTAEFVQLLQSYYLYL